ncbi:hypothetical protein BCT66_17780 [Vibrio sp. 10N.261.49.E11]|nr:hypothetical protein BCT66_17780 [Vibrio sp. 10N.261.49.E11]
MITLLVVYSIWNVTFYLISGTGNHLNTLSLPFFLAFAMLPNLLGAVIALFGGLNGEFDDEDTRLFLLTSLSPIVSLSIYHLTLAGVFSHPLERFMLACFATSILSFIVLCLLTLFSEHLTSKQSNL